MSERYKKVNRYWSRVGVVTLIIFLIFAGGMVGYALREPTTVIQEVKVPDKLESLRVYASVAEHYYNISVIKDGVPSNSTFFFFEGIPRVQILGFSNFIDFVTINKVSRIYLDEGFLMLWVEAQDKVYFWTPNGGD